MGASHYEVPFQEEMGPVRSESPEDEQERARSFSPSERTKEVTDEVSRVMGKLRLFLHMLFVLPALSAERFLVLRAGCGLERNMTAHELGRRLVQ